MAIQYTNRRGDVYHLQAKGRKGGGTGYSFSRKPTGKPVDRIPEGYEIYESPEGAQVFLRKIKPSSILAKEKQLAETMASRLAPDARCIIEVDGDALVIWLADTRSDWFVEGLADIFPRGMFPIGEGQKRVMKESIDRNARYTKMYRFTLCDDVGRRFSAERWCFRGSIDDWFPLDYGKPLGDLLEKYLPHLGRESFYELM